MRTITVLKLSTSIAMGLASAPALANQAAETLAPSDSAASAPVPSNAAPEDNGDSAGATSATQAEQGAGLQDIIVTAQRRSENLQRAAVAISAVSADTLLRAGVTDTTQLTRIAPAIQIGTIGGSLTAFYLRGVGNFTANSLSDAAVAVNLDGVPIVRSNAVQGMFYDLERVEVLKGPQGTLYGRNATGGAINLLTAKPRAGELSGYVNAEYGNYNATKVQGAVNLPAGDDGAFRLAGLFSNRDGFYSDGLGDERMRAIRFQAAAKLTDTLKVTLGSDYSYVGGRGSGSTVSGLDKDDLIGLGDPRAQAVYSASYAPGAGAFLEPLDVSNVFNRNRYWGMFAQADLQTGIGTFTLLPSFRNAKVEYRDVAGAFYNNDQLNDDQTTVELRLASDSDGPLSYLFGGFFLDERFSDNANYIQGFQQFSNIVTGSTKSYAAFGRLTYSITDALRVTGGLRYTIDKKSVDINSVGSLVICPAVSLGGNCIGTPTLPDIGNSLTLPSFIATPDRTPVTGPFGSPLPYGGNGALLLNFPQITQASQTFKKATYRVGIEYDVAPQSLLYASYETGFKSGGFFASSVNPVYQPETINAITIGSKNRFLDNKLQLNIEAFWWNYSNQQVSHFRLTPLPGGGGVVEFATENVGKTRVRGIEVEARARVAADTTLNMTVQYLDAKYRDFTYQNPVAVGPPVSGCPSTTDGVSYTINCSGRQAINAPTWTIIGGVEQAFHIAGGRLVFNLDVRYESSSYKGFEQLPSMKQDAYFLGNLQVQYEFPDSHLTVGGFVNNFTNEKVVNFSTPHQVAPNLIINNLRPPRFYGVRAGYKF